MDEYLECEKCRKLFKKSELIKFKPKKNFLQNFLKEPVSDKIFCKSCVKGM